MPDADGLGVPLTSGQAAPAPERPSSQTPASNHSTLGEAEPREMRIGYFGGTFDPPHRGHLAVACAARDRFALDRVLLAPTARQPLKRGGPVASWADRLHMVTLLCAGQPRLEASSIDGPQPSGQPNYTVDTLRRLRADLSLPTEPAAGAHSRQPATTGPVRIFGILGADAFLGLPHWREPELLLEMADWIVVNRPGFQAEVPNQPRLHRLLEVDDPVSATELRARLRTGDPCGDLLPPLVAAYIHQQGLYREPASHLRGKVRA